ncbi:MAG: hypothetical protein JO320_16320 [Alphaproteobacteria bacterium]|nr:hypothetical protein [Alphaproteobacteria bacterium]
MRIRITMAAIAITLLGTAPVAHAQGSMTQDPGRITPGNLSSDRLGPSTGSSAAGTTVFHGTPGGTAAGGSVNGAAPDYSGDTSGSSGPPGSATRNGPSGAGGTTAIGGRR